MWTQTTSGIWVVEPFPGGAQCLFISTFSSVVGSAIWYLNGLRQPLPLPAPAVWHNINPGPLFADIVGQPVAIDVGGFKIITAGMQTGLANLTFGFRTPGSSVSPAQYVDQAAATAAAQGERYYFHGCPVILGPDGTFDFVYSRGDAYKGEYPNGALPAYPQGAAYEVTVCIEKVYVV